MRLITRILIFFLPAALVLQMPLAYLILYHDPVYMQGHLGAARTYLLVSFLLMAGALFFIVRFTYRWGVRRPIEQLSRTMRNVLKGRSQDSVGDDFLNTDFAPLAKNLDQVLNELRRMKSAVSKPEVLASPVWNAERLRDEVKRLFGDSQICVIANREPYIHNKKGSKIEVLLPASGLVSGVEPIVRACSGLWIGHGSGSADRETVDKNDIVLVPPGKPEYALKRVWLSKEEEQGYYFGFANEGLWPLCHIAHTRPIFRKEDWEHYKTVNHRFAETFCREMKGKRPIALIQDYHFALVPALIRKIRPDAVTSLFWHIPWPNFEAIAICPWKNDILRGMLGADLIGFHTQYHCNNFLDAVDRFLEARVDRDNFSVTIQGHTCYVKPFPISIEWPPQYNAQPDKIPFIRNQVLEELGLAKDTIIGIGVDRLDYTKGIIERFLAVGRLLEKHPELVGRFVFIQIGAPSRTQIKRYQDLNAEVKEVTDRINWRFQQSGYEPIMLRLAHHNAEEVFRFYRAADVCFVSSLHDGMNLVAKEFVASRSDFGGMLVLSSFTGAAKELRDALIVNPYDVEESSDALYQAIMMPPEERETRMSRLRNVVAQNNVFNWAAQFISEIAHISEERVVKEPSQMAASPEQSVTAQETGT